ncbi:MAG TPA: VOC family protein, partial [Blastocatellia bacterium]|nr:VOC family protein [Blastocatellia bacterium]
MSEVKKIPEGFHTVTPSLIVHDGAAAIDFYKRAFGAEELFRMTTPDGSKIAHAEIKIGDSIIFLGDEWPGFGLQSPKTLGSTTSALNIYCEDTDAAFARAVEAGATVGEEPKDAFWGDRHAAVIDPFGHRWSLMTHVKDMTPEEIGKAAEAFFSQMSS